MTLLLADENFNGNILRGLRLRRPNLDIVQIPDAATIPDFACERVRDGLPMPGVLIVRRSLAVGQALDEILLVIDLSLEGEWESQVRYLPL